MISNPYLMHKLVMDRQAEIRRAMQQSRSQAQPGQTRMPGQLTMGRFGRLSSRRGARLPQASRQNRAYV